MVKNLFIVNKKDSSKNRKLAYFLNFLFIILLLAIILFFAFSKIAYNYNFKAIWDYRAVFLRGFGLTLGISAISLIFSIIIGTILALGVKSKIYFLKALSKMLIEIIRGTPLLVQVLIFFYVIAPAVHINNRIVSGVIILSIFSGAYLAEIIRGGLLSIDKSNYETAKAIGLTKLQTYIYIIIPQVIRTILPAVAGQLVNLIKDSSLLSIIAVKEFTMAANEMSAATFSTLEAYLPLAVGYLIITIPISFLTKYLERKFQYEH